MKRMFLILLPLIFLACEENINVPETKSEKKAVEFLEAMNTYDVVETAKIIFYSKDGTRIGLIEGMRAGENGYINIPGIVQITESVSSNSGSFPISLTAGMYERFAVNEAGQLIKINGLDASKAKNQTIVSDGFSFSPQRLAMWRGELYEPPKDPGSGDEYYDRNTKKILKFIQSENRWVER